MIGVDAERADTERDGVGGESSMEDVFSVVGPSAFSDGAAPSLSARRFLYAVFQSLLGQEPSHKQLDALDPELVGQAFEIMGASGASADAFVAAINRARSSDDESLDSLRTTYTALFVGPGKLAADPWESVYVNEDAALFQRSTLGVRNAYRVQGLLPAEYPRVADDHIAIECGFLAALAARACDAEGAGDALSMRDHLMASQEFLHDHLLVWVGEYAKRLSMADNGLYGSAALALDRFAHADEKTLRLL